MYRDTLGQVAKAITAVVGPEGVDYNKISEEIILHAGKKKSFDFVIVKNGRSRKTRIAITPKGYRIGFTK